jgi:hypothetical protein
MFTHHPAAGDIFNASPQILLTYQMLNSYDVSQPLHHNALANRTLLAQITFIFL